MVQIPLVIDHEEDELYSSWIIRLAQANLLPIIDFLNTYISPNYAFDKFSYRNMDLRIPFEYYIKALRVSHNFDAAKLFLETTTFTASAPFMSKEQRQRYLNTTFNVNRALLPLYPEPHGLGEGILICPECAKEELATKGYWYIHRAHNISGVKICYKHKCRLEIINTRYAFLDTTALPQTEPMEYEDKALHLQYAQFAKDFLDAQIDCSIDSVRTLILQGLTENTVPKMADGYRDIIDGDIAYFLKTQIKGVYVNEINAMATLMFMFHDVETLKKELQSISSEPDDDFARQVRESEYELVSPYRHDIVRLRHKACGKTFCTSPYGFRIGWQCPACDTIDVQEKYRELVDKVGEGEYSPVSDFSGMDKNIDLLHNVCGKTIRTRARSFLFEGVRCDCDWRIPIEVAEKKVREAGDFELVNFERADKPCKILHNKCGKTFTMYFHKFIASPRCRVCERKGHLSTRTTDDFIRDMQDLVGDEYELIGEYSGPRQRVSIRHKVCGMISDYKPYAFLDGARCRNCNKQMTDAAFRKYVNEFSAGIYVVEKERPSSNLYAIRNTVTEETINLSKGKVLQELHRPTPSDFLPLDKKMPAVADRSKLNIDIVMGCLQKRRTQFPDMPFFTEDIREETGLTGDQVVSVLQKFKREKKIMSVTLGVYAFPEDKWSVEDIIRAKYIVRDGKHIGFYRGDSFAYEIGIRNQRPDEYSCCTNKESFKTPNRTTKVMNEKIHIRGNRYTIDDRNYKILAVIDFLVQYKQLSYETEAVYAAIRAYLQDKHSKISKSEVMRYINEYEAVNIKNYLTKAIESIYRSK